jgi:hypothetical protein
MTHDGNKSLLERLGRADEGLALPLDLFRDLVAIVPRSEHELLRLFHRHGGKMVWQASEDKLVTHLHLGRGQRAHVGFIALGAAHGYDRNVA